MADELGRADEISGANEVDKTTVKFPRNIEPDEFHNLADFLADRLLSRIDYRFDEHHRIDRVHLARVNFRKTEVRDIAFTITTDYRSEYAKGGCLIGSGICKRVILDETSAFGGIEFNTGAYEWHDLQEGERMLISDVRRLVNDYFGEKK